MYMHVQNQNKYPNMMVLFWKILNRQLFSILFLKIWLSNTGPKKWHRHVLGSYAWNDEDLLTVEKYFHSYLCIWIYLSDRRRCSKEELKVLLNVLLLQENLQLLNPVFRNWMHINRAFQGGEAQLR